MLASAMATIQASGGTSCLNAPIHRLQEPSFNRSRVHSAEFFCHSIPGRQLDFFVEAQLDEPFKPNLIPVNISKMHQNVENIPN